jgi:hypothetical protein
MIWAGVIRIGPLAASYGGGGIAAELTAARPVPVLSPGVLVGQVAPP